MREVAKVVRRQLQQMLQTVKMFHCLLHCQHRFFFFQASVMQHMLHALILDPSPERFRLTANNHPPRLPRYARCPDTETFVACCSGSGFV
jgi:hypothetical protein